MQPIPLMTRVPSLLLPLALAAGASGCGWFGLPGAGIVTGVVTYDGRPAPGKRVALAGGGGSKVAATDANGRYTFNNVAAGRWQVQYVGVGDDRAAAASERLGETGVVPNEVAQWRSLAFETVEGSGKEVPGFEVAYNGLLYPEFGMALVVSAEAVVPFHWSTHPRAQRYRVTVTAEGGTFKWSSPWVAEPTAVFGQAVGPGRYQWNVEIDGGEAGTGTTRARQVDF